MTDTERGATLIRGRDRERDGRERVAERAIDSEGGVSLSLLHPVTRTPWSPETETKETLKQLKRSRVSGQTRQRLERRLQQLVSLSS